MKLSIITINYNNCDGLQKTIDSVIAQTWRDFEWIVIDGGSTDGSKELLEQYKEHFSYWCSEPDKGIYNAMNKGICHVKGEYVNFMNSGDKYYEEDTLQKVFSHEHTSDVLYGDWEQIYEDHTRLMHFPTPVSVYALYRRNICHQAMFIHAELLKSAGYDETFPILADYARNIDAILNGATFEFLGDIVCKYDMNGLTSCYSEDLAAERERFLTKYSDTLLLTLKYIDEYEYDRPIQRTKELVNKGGILAFITKAFLKMMDKLFLHIDFTSNQYVG